MDSFGKVLAAMTTKNVSYASDAIKK